MYSQAPEKFTYQSIVRYSDGSLLKSSNLGIKISILKNSDEGASVYAETHNVTTNRNGLVTLTIGNGVSGDNISDIDWSSASYYLKVEVDPNGGIGYTIEQTAQLLSVPYALFAGNSSGTDLDKDMTGILPVSKGGTGSSTSPMIAVVTAPNASVARGILGIGEVGGSKVVLKDVTDNYLTIKETNNNSGDQELTAGIVPITLGGTGSTTAPMVGVITAANAAAARAVLEIDASGTDNSTPVTLSDVTDNYLTLSGQEITSGTVPVTLGGTGATDAATARTNLGLGTIATQASDAVSITGGAIDGTKIGETTQTTGAFTTVNANTVSAGIFQSSGDTDVTLKTGNATTGNITIANGADGDINISPVGDGKVRIDNLLFPSTDGTAGQVLKTDGSGKLVWESADAAGTDNSTAVTLTEITDNYLTLDGQEITSGTVPVALGGTGSTTAPMVGVITAADAAASRDSLSLGTIATQASDAVAITGGAIDGTKVGETTQTTGAFTSVNANTVSAGIFQSSGDTDVTLKTGNAITGNITIANGADGNIHISPNGTGQVEADNVNLKGTTKVAGTALTASAAELNILDGDNSAESVSIASGDRMIINDEGVMKQVTVPVVGDYILSSLNLNSLGDAKTGGTNFTGSMLIGHESAANLTADAQYNLGIGLETLQSLTEGDYNIAIGTSALKDNQSGSYNTILGAETMSSNTTGSYNVAVGFRSLLLNLTGGYNTALGYQCMYNNLADANTGIGYSSLYGNTSGVNNTGVGYWSLWANQTGSNNTAVGKFALQGVTDNSFSNNTAVGYNAGKAITTGTQNIAMGVAALTAITTGSDNTALGFDSLKVLTTGSQNVVIGSGADVSANSASNQIVIGYGATGGGDNTVVIGNEATVSMLPPGTSGEVSIGSSSKQLKDIYVDGVAYTDALGFGTTAITLPTADGTTGQVLKTDGSGTLSWTGSLEQITENSQTGYRFSGAPNANYGDIGINAVDLSYSDAASNFGGASGLNSFASGYKTEATGAYSFGAGKSVISSGTNSTAFGDRTASSAVNSTTFGTGTIASDFNSFVIGHYNSVGSTTTTDGSNSSYDADNSVFVIGNGADSDNKSDAFVVYSSGNTNVGGTLTVGGAFTLPASIGSSGEVLKVASGTTLEWGSSGGATSISGLSDGFTPTANSVYLGTGEDYDMTSSNSQYNVAVGTYAMRNANADSDDVAVGYDALNGPNPGSSNTAIGSNALKAMNGGGSNVGLGYGAGNVITTGDNNVIIGSGADPSANDASNEIVIGQGTTGVAPGAVTLGNASITDVYMAQDMGATVHADGVKFYEDTGGNYVGFNSAASLTGNQVWTLPEVDGNDGQVLKTGGNGVLDWVNNSGVAGGIDDLSDAKSVAAPSESIYIGGSTQTSTRIGNTSLGWHAMSIYTSTNAPNTIDGGNTAIGYRALRDLKTGRFNSAVGYHSLVTLQSGDSNVAIGTHNATSMTSGDSNIFIGRSVGGELTTGSSGNVLIGKDANVDSGNTNASNQIVIGYQATGIDDNTVVLGNSSVDKLYAAQDGAAVIYANASINSSDLRFKTLIKPIEPGLQFIKKLNPVSYYKISKSQYKGEEDNNKSRYEYGLIAQEVEDILKELDPDNSIITKDDEGFYGMDYKQITMPLIKAVQEQQKSIDTLKKVNEDLVQRLEAIEKLLLK